MECTANEAWDNVICRVLKYGKSVTINCADGKTRATQEVMGDTIVLNMAQPVVSFTKRKPSYRFMAADAAWILSGSDKVADIEGYSKNVQKYSDDGITFFGAYGPKIIGQLDYVVKTLLEDPSSRRAVLTIWRENPPATKDTPCTLSAQFLIRDDFLECIVTMRSSDVWIGLPYDIFTFSMIAATVALRLKKGGTSNNAYQVRGLGNLVNFAGSRHLYQQDVEKITALNWVDGSGPTDEFSKKTMFNVHNFKDEKELLDHLWAIAKGDKAGLKDSFLSDLPHFTEVTHD